MNLTIELTKRDFAERFSGSSLGVSWLVLAPVVNIFIYIVVFSELIGARIPGVESTLGYGVYLVSGLLPWVAFSNTVSRMSTVYVDKRHLISKIRLDLKSFPVFVVLSETVVFLFSCVVFLAFLLYFEFEMSRQMIWFPVIYVLQQFFAFGLGFLLAIFHVFLRDLKEFVSVSLQLWFWLTPIVYTFDILPDYASDVLHMNPAYLFIGAYHNIFVFDSAPALDSLLLLFVIGLSLMLAGFFLCSKLERDIRDFL